jgi:hypothetical protein
MDSCHGIVEGGVVKMTGPVFLPEKTRVRIVPEESAPATDDIDSEEVILKQQAAWRELFAQIRDDPDCVGPDDGWDPARHDEILYGGPNVSDRRSTVRRRGFEGGC